MPESNRDSYRLFERCASSAFERKMKECALGTNETG
jgi:hypothetical protein